MGGWEGGGKNWKTACSLALCVCVSVMCVCVCMRERNNRRRNRYSTKIIFFLNIVISIIIFKCFLTMLFSYAIEEF